MTDIEDLDADEATPDPVHKVLGKQIKHLREQAGLNPGGVRQTGGLRHGPGLLRRTRPPRGQAPVHRRGRTHPGRAWIAEGKAVEEDIDEARLRYPAFFREFARLETEAVELHEYATMVVPGLLQTEEYARALYRMRRPLLDEETVEHRVAARLARQTIFNRWPPPTLSFVLEEVVLQRPFGSADVLRGQLRQLIAFGRMRHVELQVMPIKRSDHPGVAGPLILLETSEGQKLAYTEAQGRNVWFTKREDVRTVDTRYGIIRAQALTPRESLDFIETLLGDA